MGDLIVKRVLQLKRFFRHLAKRDRNLEKHSGNLACPFVLAEISERLHTNEPILSAVFQLHGDGDRGVAGE